jgi:hypothetical protein
MLLPVALAIALLAAGCNGTPVTPAPSASPSPSASLAALPSPPPWPAPADVAERVKAAGLSLMKSEGMLVHYHPHVDVFYQGQPVVVPANVGIDTKGSTISPLHTHAASGVLHIEASSAQTITLGQFFTEWGVSLEGAQVYLDGKAVADPANLSLADHQEIAVVFGTPPATIPDVYNGSWF